MTWTGRVQDPDSDFRFLIRKLTCLTMVHETVQKNKKTLHSRGAVGTSTRAAACASASKPLCTVQSNKKHTPLRFKK